MNRVRVFCDEMITLKKGFNNQVLQSSIQKVIPIKSHKPPQYEVKCHAIHDEDNQVIRLKAYLLKNKRQIIHGANCLVKVYSITKSDFSEALIFTATNVVSPNSLGEFIISLSEVDLSSEFLGEKDFAVEVEITRFLKTFKHKFYFNELGIYDFALRIRRRLITHELEIKDHGIVL